jgi:hypothetical protein
MSKKLAVPRLFVDNLKKGCFMPRHGKNKINLNRKRKGKKAKRPK